MIEKSVRGGGQDLSWICQRRLRVHYLIDRLQKKNVFY